eukprot:m51a1_g9444 hypothetical protein (1007) ;mRNA; f:457448-461621
MSVRDAYEDLDLTVLKRLRFREPVVESAYRSFYADIYSGRKRVAFYCATQLVSLALLGAMTALRDSGSTPTPCPDRWFVFMESGYAALLTLFWALHTAGAIRPGLQTARVQGAITACPGLFFGAALVLGSAHCHAPGPASSEESINWPMLPVAAAYLTTFSNSLQTASAWPHAGVIALLSYVPIIGALVYLWASVSPTFWYITVTCPLGPMGLFVLGCLASWEARKDYAAHLMLERERRQSAVDRKATDAIIQALFPRDVAAKLIDTRVLPVLRLGAVLNSTGGSLADAGLDLSSHASDPVFARQYESAAVLCAVIWGLDEIEFPERRLGVASRYHVAADGLASCYGVEKITSFGDCIVFACGVPAPATNPTLNICEFAIALQRLAQQMKADALDSPISFKIGLSIASRLAENASPGQIIASKDVARNMSGILSFETKNEATMVKGIGNVMFVSETTCVDFRQRAEVTISSTLKESITIQHPDVNPVGLWYRSFDEEIQFLRYLGSKYITFQRVLYLTGAVSLTLIRIASFNFFGHRAPLWWALYVALVFAVWLMFGETLLPLRRRPLLHTALLSACTVPYLIAISVQFLSHVYVDGYMLTPMGFLWFVHGSKLPFYVGAPLTLCMLVMAVPMFALGWMPVSSAANFALTTFVLLSTHQATERHIRTTYSTALTMEANKRDNLREKELGAVLIKSVIPEQILASLSKQSDGMYLANSVPSATALVIRITDFAALYKMLDAGAIVRLLNSLFSLFDSACARRGLLPLRTVADEYVVVGNVLTDAEDHAERVTGLAADILAEFGDWNSNSNPVRDKMRIAIKMGIHTDEILSGLVITKCCMFDCWGRAVVIAQALCSEALPLTVLVSASTAGYPNREPFRRLNVNGEELCAFLLQLEHDVPTSTAASLKNWNEIAFVPTGDVDYGFIPSVQMAWAGSLVVPSVPEGQFCIYAPPRRSPSDERPCTPAYGQKTPKDEVPVEADGDTAAPTEAGAVVPTMLFEMCRSMAL